MYLPLLSLTRNTVGRGLAPAAYSFSWNLNNPQCRAGNLPPAAMDSRPYIIYMNVFGGSKPPPYGKMGRASGVLVDRGQSLRRFAPAPFAQGSLWQPLRVSLRSTHLRLCPVGITQGRHDYPSVFAALSQLPSQGEPRGGGRSARVAAGASPRPTINDDGKQSLCRVV